MKLLVVALGTRMPEWVDAGFGEYAQRMPREARVELLELRPEKRDGRPVAALLEAERQRIEAALPAAARLVALDERGEAWTTRRLADALERWLAEGRDTAFVIGSADGLHERIARRADIRLALSPMTLPHGLVRVLLAEQLYRAMSLLRNHPYHRE